MTDLNAIESQLQTNLSVEGSPLLADLFVDIKAEVNYALPMVDIYQLVVSEATLNREVTGLTLTGKTTLLGVPGSQLSVVVVEDNNNVNFALVLIFPEQASITLPGFNGWGIVGLRFDLAINGVNNLVPAIVTSLLGTIKLGSLEIPVELSIPVADQAWRLAGAFRRLPLPDLSVLVSLLGDGEIFKIVPEQLRELEGFELQAFDLTFDSATGNIAGTSLRMASSQSLSFCVPKLVIDDLSLFLESDNPLNAEKRISQGQISGTLALGSVALSVSVGLPPGGAGLRLATSPGLRYALPDLSGLSSQFFSADLLPPVLHQLRQVKISDFACEIDTDAAALAMVGFALQTQSDLALIPGSFVLRNPRLSLQVLYPGNETQRMVFGNFRGAFRVGDLSIPISGEIAEEISFSAVIEKVSLAELLTPLLGSQLGSQVDLFKDVALQHILLEGSTAGEFSIAAGVSCTLSALAGSIGIALPDSLNELSPDRLALSRDVENQRWQLDIISEPVVPFDVSNPDSIKIMALTLGLTHSRDGNTRFNCSFTMDGQAQLSPELALQFNQLKFNWQQTEKSWGVDGSVTMLIAGREYTLEAAITLRDGAHSIALNYPGVLQLSDLGGGGSLLIEGLSLFSLKNTIGSKTTQQWGVSGASHIKINNLLEAQGTITLATGPEGARLELSAKAPQLPVIPLSLGLPSNPELLLVVDDLTIAYGRDGKGQAEWVLATSACLQITNIPDLLNNYLPPEELRGQLRADGQSVAISFNVPSTLQPTFPALALTFANDITLSLGQPEIRVTAIELQLGDQPRLLQKIHATLPRQLNYLFGRDAEGQPNMDLFNDDFELHLVMAKKLGLVIATSPFKPLAFYEVEGDDGLWTQWDFGQVGKISFRVPEFSYDAGRWKASGGFNRLTELALPLTPFKFLLEQCGFPQTLTAPIPDTIPLRDVDLTGDNFAQEMKLLLGDQLLGRLDKNVSAVLNEMFDAVKSVIDRLPTRLQKYLQIRIPKSAIFEISIDSKGGGSTLGLRTLPEDPALNFLFPMMLGVPELVGFSLSSLSVGQKLGGTLVQIEIDGQIDRFDMVSLIAALGFGQQDISNHYILEKTLCLIPAGLPLPIPLFFSHLGLDYRDILGFNIQAHWSYPDLKLGLFDSISLFTDLLDFFKNPDYLLHKEGFAETLVLELTIGENFIALPQYLGGQILGLQQSLPTLSVGDSVARFLDFLKTGNAGYAITAIPLQYEDTWIRIGSQEIRFGPLLIGMSWCITTDEEFVDVLLPASRNHGNLPMIFDEAVLDSLPTEGGAESYKKGFIILLMGNAELGSLVGLRTEFGIAVTAQGGFETGFRMAGEIGRTLSLEISGSVQASKDSITIKGSTGLYWKDQPLVAASGRITVSDKALEVEITIELTPSFSVSGVLVIGKQGLLMAGEAAWGHGADGDDKGIGVTVDFSSGGMIISFNMRLISFDAQVTVRVPGDGDRSLFVAAVLILPDMAMQENFARDIKSLAKSISESTVDQVYQDLQNAIADVDSLEISVVGLREWLPPLCKSISARITSAINANTTGWKRPGRTTAHNKAKPYKQRLTHLRNVAQKASNRDFRPQLKAALQDLVSHNRLNITVGIPSVKWRRNSWGVPYPVYYTRQVSIYKRNLMNEQQLADLRHAIGWIDMLPDKEGMKIETQAIYDRLPDRNKLLAQIDRETEQGIDGALPQVESIAFTTSLALLNLSNLEVTVSYRRSGTLSKEKTILDITNPAKITQQLIDAFGSG